MSSHKVFIVGLDGGTLDLVRPWVEAGRLPNLGRLMAEGAYGDLAVELPPVTVPNWPSFMTGKNAGKHGVIHWFTRKKGLSEWSLVSSSSIKEPTIWEIATEAGKKSVVINVPATYPPKPIDGTMITGLLTPPSAKDFVYPAAVKDEIDRATGGYDVYSGVLYRTGNEEAFMASLMKSLDGRFKASRYLMDKEGWDIFCIVFSETDTVQHAFWKFIDPGHPLYDENAARRWGDGIFRIYERIDGYLGEYMKALDPETPIMIMSDHGAEPFYKKFYTNNWLIRLGLMAIKEGFRPRLKYWAFRRGLTISNVYRLLMKTGFINWTGKAAKNESAESLVRKVFLSYEDVDWEKTKAFAFGGFGQIYLNVAGPGGTVAGAGVPAYDRLREDLIAGLRKMEIPGVGSFTEEIYRREELYHGPYLHLLPDIVFIPRSGYVDPGDFEFGSNKLFDNALLGSGSHSKRGMFVLRGEGTRHLADLNPVTIHDLAPTILYLAGIPVPSDMDGRVLAECFDDRWLAEHPLSFAAGTAGGGPGAASYSPDEEEDVKRQLKNLGYLG
jgi:predicted AlkP superfamily phosphohydrolase/phosphomutase